MISKTNHRKHQTTVNNEKNRGKIHCVVEPPIALASSSFTSIFQMVQRQLYLIPKLMMYPIIKMRIHIKAGCCFHTLSTIKEILITIKIIDSINKSTHLSQPKKKVVRNVRRS
ncbi:hypothetical protein, unlikely [Trypanosoma brucei gambiense DAL972]|uniref:Uncharacterized protein n=1 Tax=Trypanosoma brucei gambiense (strain MHOM/CI/86/DAL972) TaxID=679716 RepID=D0A5Y7_TRYB9|nr:hypothetical protein, unlikely [Trypanosoma brucei gambiense DAL972]CBH17088.1 hypothetical protein, unlikely [Trypanosoma brucei gambiense DAL972]|eukprot:XP_011779352.1 hypothetical protein, unlikely [Trypanosoma brucei gambiense DAL972]